MKILHITECYAGGVSKAINNFTTLAPKDSQHYLLWHGEDDPGKNPNFQDTSEFRKSIFSRLTQVRKSIDAFKPDVIVAHSSWAGFYARIIQRKVPVIYEPHCYVFEDKSRSRISRLIFFVAEKILSLNTELVLVLSPHEKRTQQIINKNNYSILLPNINSMGVNYKFKENEELKKIINSRKKAYVKIVMLGRLSQQKDPDWFASVADKIHERNPNQEFRFIWIGDGSEEYKIRLKASKIEVTGWKESSEVFQILSETDIYVHSAYYEGFPIAVLDALALDVPAVVRDIPAYHGTPLEVAESVDVAVQKITEIIESDDKAVSILKHQSTLMHVMNQDTQSEAISRSLELVVNQK